MELNKCTAQAKGQLLYEFFPGEIPPLLDFIQYTSENILAFEDDNRDRWNHPNYTFTTWLYLIRNVELAVAEFKKCKKRDAYLFATLLYKGNQSLYINHCVRLYIKDKRCQNPKFIQTFDLLFNT
ncbi:hypothetical protein [Pedobacter sp. WC2423]|uniref:hypothetical protein n=1 Tax=Pedobacter sp. WC2423 TaxID=3234142 RepID=UPI003465BC73